MTDAVERLREDLGARDEQEIVVFRNDLEIVLAQLDSLRKVAMNAKGAYEALKLVGADKHLPGYQHCVDNLNDALQDDSSN